MGRINDNDIQQIRGKISLVDIVSEHVSLKKSGRTYKGLCPFHQEHTPSFHVDPAKQLYHCFGCGAGGDVFTFLMAQDGLSFMEAVETAARKIGFTLKLEHSPLGDNRSRLLKACQQAMEYYHRQLMSPPGARALEYLRERSLEKLIDRFQIGYAPDWSSMIDQLRAGGVSEADMISAGLAVKSSKGSLIDRFHHRLIFPITDATGRPVAFGGRVLDQSLPKYLNSPQTPIYNKSAVLFGLSQGKNACMKHNTAVVVEGYTDLLAMVGSGIACTTATLGTAFTAEHLRLLSRFADRILLVFDGDSAGQTAAERSVDYVNWQRLPGQEVLDGLVDKIGLELLVASLPEGLDPADFIEKYGAAALKAELAKAKPLVKFLIDRIISKHESKRSGTQMAAMEGSRLLSKIKSPVAQEEYLRYLGDRLDLQYNVLAAELKRSRLSETKSRKTTAGAERRLYGGAEREFLSLVLQWPEKSSALKDVGVEEWEETPYRRLGVVLKSLLAGKPIEANDILHKIDPELHGLVAELLLEPLPSGDRENYFAQLFLKLKELALERRINKLRKLLETTNARDKEYDVIFKNLMDMETKRRELKA